jgi:hypothetical protein
MTGATGDLTPDEIQRDFQPGEWREASGADHQGDVTRSQRAHSHARRESGADLDSGEGPTELAGRQSGYGSEEGLSSDDPAYRMEVRPPSPRIDDPRTHRDTRIGGDERGDHEEHL